MKPKQPSLIPPLLLLLGLLPATTLPLRAQFTYQVYNGVEVMITRYDCSDSVATIPETIDGLPVTLIGWEAFVGCWRLTHVTIPSSVTSIGAGAFQDCTNLTALEVDPANPSYSSLDGVLFDKSLTALVRYPLGKPGDYTIPSSVTNVSYYAFDSCTGPTNIVIPNSVTSIGHRAFSYCTTLTSITIPNSISSIDGEMAFAHCTRLTNVVIPASVTNLSNYAFSYCALTNIIIPSSVTSIGNGTFLGCFGLAAITIPASVTSIGEGAFAYCGRLSNVTIPDSVTNVSSYAFSYCFGLTNVTILNGDASIGQSAFAVCSQLPYARIGNGAMLLQRGPCDGSVTIPETIDGLPVTHLGDGFGPLGDGLFYGCTNLTNIRIPSSLTNIPSSAFNGSSLTAFEVDPANPVYSSLDGVLFAKSQTTLIGYPRGKAGAYTIPVGVASIGGQAFAYCSNLSRINMPSSLTSIGNGAFRSCTLLTSVIIPTNVSNVSDSAFSYCTALTNIAIPDRVSSIEGWTFASCHRLVSVILPHSVTSIGSGAFSDCRSLTNFVLPSRVTNIGSSAFSGCISMTSVIIPSRVTRIEYFTFVGCIRLSSVYWEGNAPSDGGDSLMNTPATLYYLPGATGWGTTFGTRPTALWVRPEPTILTHDSRFGPQTNGFGFVVSWATNTTVTVDASPTLTNPSWSPISTHPLVNGTAYFTDTEWASHSSRFYRVRQQ